MSAVKTDEEIVEEIQRGLSLDSETKETLEEIEDDVVNHVTIADLIREGSEYTDQEVGGWGKGENACALKAAELAAKARGII